MLFTLSRVSPRARVALLSLLLPWMLLVPGAALSRSGAPPQFASLRADGSEVWWNEEWARIVAVRGSWKPSSDDGGLTVLRPEDPICSIAIMSRSTGEVFDYAMELEGEVVLSSGWIMVSPARRAVLSDRVDGPSQDGLSPASPGHPSMYALPQVERLTWSHPERLVAFRTTGSRRLSLQYSATDLDDAAGLEVHLVTRNSHAYAVTEAETALSLTQFSLGRGQSGSLRITTGKPLRPK